jgi:uncharacterized protein (TIGR02679 family)
MTDPTLPRDSAPLSEASPRLHKLLGGDDLAALRCRLRRHFERASPDATPQTLRLTALSAREREALALLTGRPPRDARSMQIELGPLDASLRDAGIASSLRDALERLDGPLVNRAAALAEANAGWSAVLGACCDPDLSRYLQGAAAFGLLKRLARQDMASASQLLGRAEAVLRRLPAGGLPRAQLAAETLGNAHALDNGQATATLVLGAWRHLEADRPDAALPEDSEGSAAEERVRDVWARAGVLVNELARPALCLNLPVADGEVPVCNAGEPAYLSLRRLLRTPPRWAVAGRSVFVCENPNLLAMAADRLGERCAPLVCTDGMPAAAQRSLLTQLSQSGARLKFHGDFDWPGLQIANHVVRTWGAVPWRYVAADYEAAAAAAPHAGRDLPDSAIVALWDAALAPAMRHHGLVIAEEAVAAALWVDLTMPVG